MNILIIEDDVLQSLNLKLHLGELGYRDVVIANNIERVKAATNISIFDLIFCDIRMPDADGILLLSSYLKKQMSSAIIIVSAVDDTIKQLTMGMCRQLGYSYVSTLAKPFSREQLTYEINYFNSHLLDTQTSIHTYLPIDIDLKLAFSNNLFFPLYQPQFSFITGELVGVEALVRLEHPKRGIVLPREFLPQINELGLMKELYVFMLKKTTKAIGLMNSPIHLSLNINKELLDWNLFEHTVSICEETGFPLDKLTLELTEEQAYSSTLTALENLARLSLHGVKFAIDDFGTGYASLEQLIDLPISELKIDRVFIARATRDYKHQQLTLAAIRLAKSLGLQCVTEGVENSETWEYLKNIGADICQGHYTGKPMAIHDINALYRASKKTRSQTQSRKNVETIVIFDLQGVRANAMTKILSRENNQFIFITATYIEQLRHLIRDLLVSVIVVDFESFSSLSNKEQEDLKSLVSSRNRIFLVNENRKDDLTNFSPLVIKSEDITKTSKILYENIESMILSRNKKNKMPLSRREENIAQLLLSGVTNKHIAYELDISQKTVSSFKSRIFQKLGVKSLIELAQKM
ncbi:EAL domain-containing protein [Photobacterium leiognathi]|uniref:EAL domain-containing protein n=1 Tax=Photobacterium leiognathi TaxID=553611 RepID=UPI0027392BD3|nr:EAL domain-containing protein [Photobacterium leiognathi]